MPQVDDALLTLVIGVTGHRDIPPQEYEPLAARVTELLLSLRRDYPSLPLLMLNPLAEGGDRIAARAAVALGVPLLVPIPFSREEYERDFDTPRSLEEFRSLIAGAQVRELPLAPGISAADIAVARAGAEPAVRASLASFVSSHCQVLLALSGRTSQ